MVAIYQCRRNKIARNPLRKKIHLRIHNALGDGTSYRIIYSRYDGIRQMRIVLFPSETRGSKPSNRAGACDVLQTVQNTLARAIVGRSKTGHAHDEWVSR